MLLGAVVRWKCPCARIELRSLIRWGAGSIVTTSSIATLPFSL
jgi:hypothetical protein